MKLGRTKEECAIRNSIPLKNIPARNWCEAIQIVSEKQSHALVVSRIIDIARQLTLEETNAVLEA